MNSFVFSVNNNSDLIFKVFIFCGFAGYFFFFGLSAVWCSGLERCFTTSMIAGFMVLLPVKIRCLKKIFPDWSAATPQQIQNLTSSKLKKSEAKLTRKPRKQKQTLRESGFVLRIAPPLLFPDRNERIKTTNQSLTLLGSNNFN